MEKSEILKFQGVLSQKQNSHNIATYLHELHQVSKVNSGEKSPQASDRRRGKGTIFKYVTALCSS